MMIRRVAAGLTFTEIYDLVDTMVLELRIAQR
jgi:hypothetical protein